MLENYFALQKLAQADHQLRLAQAARNRERAARMRELQARRRLAKAVRVARAAGLPPEEVRATLRKALRAVS
jgi:hypothetical protein